MDAFIRQHKVWIPEQMFEEFQTQLREAVSKKQFNRSYKCGVEVWNSSVSDKWLLSEEGQKVCIERMQRKYEKDTPIARANSPIVERVRFGLFWDQTMFFDISFGLKLGHSYIETEKLKKYPHTPWSILHVQEQLNSLYQSNLENALKSLSNSPIEIAFYKYWLENYFKNSENPALIPEVCGFRAKFYYYEFEDKIYSSHNEIGKPFDLGDVHPKNFRFDFFVSNTRKNKAVLIELDGQEFHKTKSQRIIDSIKRNEAAKLNIPVVVFTGTKIKENIESCFLSIENILKN